MSAIGPRRYRPKMTSSDDDKLSAACTHKPARAGGAYHFETFGGVTQTIRYRNTLRFGGNFKAAVGSAATIAVGCNNATGWGREAEPTLRWDSEQ